ncbi:MAG: GNAT family N-acetyltransferase [Coriobacteriales bacterium]|jgi:ribosomal protein S18 acetylase RimI-like enzyme|nr:GNAT family N-acetyltransferase [Coriobacteriales bacterium]
MAERSMNIAKTGVTTDTSRIIVRLIRESEYGVLPDFLYLAIFLAAGAEPPSRDIIKKPEFAIYIDSFGGEEDCGVVAELDGKIVGAAWTRIIPAYGHVNNATPELAISVLSEFRNSGIGTQLMRRLFELLAERGYKQTSLAVQKESPAVRFYKRLGYESMSESKGEFIMVKSLAESAESIV